MYQKQHNYDAGLYLAMKPLDKQLLFFWNNAQTRISLVYKSGDREKYKRKIDNAENHLDEMWDNALCGACDIASFRQALSRWELAMTGK